MHPLLLFIVLQICDEIGVKSPVNVKMFTGKSKKPFLYITVLATVCFCMHAFILTSAALLVTLQAAQLPAIAALQVCWSGSLSTTPWRLWP